MNVNIPPERFERLCWQLLRGADRKNAFLHVGKTGGTSLNKMFVELRDNGQNHPLNFDHTWTMRQIVSVLPKGGQVHVVLRDPIERYVSGFNSRLRQGRPNHPRLWTESEATAFQYFQSPTDLFRAMISEDELEQSKAAFAIHAIPHMRRGYVYHYISTEFLQNYRQYIGLVGGMSDLNGFSLALKRRLGVQPSLTERISLKKLHMSPVEAGGSDGLTSDERARLKEKLADEYAIHDKLREIGDAK